ncbi:MAG: AAA family ATPase [Thermodesulfobacteriota bacterium]
MEYLEIIGDDKFLNYECIKIDDKVAKLPPPDELDEDFDETFVETGREKEIIDQALAAWRANYHFVLKGPSGVGKTTIVFRLGRLLKKDVYIFNGSDSTQADEIACGVAPTNDHNFELRASEIFTAALRGQICCFDDLQKCPGKSLARLNSLLDRRRSLYAALLNVRIKAHKEFLSCAAINEDESLGNELPKDLVDRLLPAIYVGYPCHKDLEKILIKNLPEVENMWIEAFLEKYRDQKFSPRIAIKLLGYANTLYNNGICRKIDRGKIKEYLSKAEQGMSISKPSQQPDHKEDEIKKKKERYDEDFLLFAQKGETVH